MSNEVTNNIFIADAAIVIIIASIIVTGLFHKNTFIYIFTLSIIAAGVALSVYKYAENIVVLRRLFFDLLVYIFVIQRLIASRITKSKFFQTNLLRDASNILINQEHGGIIIWLIKILTAIQAILLFVIVYLYFKT